MSNTAEGRPVGSILVVGAGVAGIRAALDLAEVGYRVLLTDNSPAIGGILSKLDYQFPNDHCGMCKMLPVVGREYASQYCMRKSLFHDNIKIMPFTDVTDITGEPGAFHVHLTKKARHVDTDVCIGTGYCTEVCPIEVPDAFNQGLTKRKAIYRPVPHNLPNMYIIDMGVCDKCGECVNACPVDAINLDAEDEDLEVDFDAIIFAAGSGLYDPCGQKDLSSYAISKDVVTALEFERLLSASGSYDGAIRRPSDGKTARRIAWLQCVGSRNRKEGKDFCSSICCMFALKEAVLAHQKGGPETETTIFYMDMRTFGKDFYRYREYAEEQHGVKLVRCRVHTVDLLKDKGLEIRFENPKTGQWDKAVFDMVVLSTGQTPPSSTKGLAQTLNIQLSELGYFPSSGFDKVKSPKDGIFMCGSFTGLTDISEALTSGSAAASEASKLLASIGREFKKDTQFPQEKAVEREAPTVNVIICRWNNGKMPNVIDFEPLRKELLHRPGISEIHIVETLCRGGGFEEAKEILKVSNCNRVLFGACLPYIYRQRLKVMAQEAGFNTSFIEVVDLRSIIQRYMAEKDIPTLMRKVKNQIIVASEKLKKADPVRVHTIPMVQQALVVGGGISGMKAALSLAERGIQVHLVEKTDDLGGRPLKRLHYTLEGLDPAALVSETKQQVWENKHITVHKNTTILKSNGSLGSFKTTIRNGDEEDLLLLHGATIIATGGHEASTKEYCYGVSKNILTQGELEDQLATNQIDAAKIQTVVMIQCVGSRQKGAHDYCSRVCCAAALKNAFKLLEKNPDLRIVILYRDLMAYGFLEQYYTKARGQGIIFASYDLGNQPKVEITDDKPIVTYNDPILRRHIVVSSDILVLSTAIEPDPSNSNLARIFNVELTQDGFFQEAESKWRPVDFLRDGIFLAGTAHSPRPITEAICQAEAAAQRAFTHLSKRNVTTAKAYSKVHESICSKCQACIAACPYEARSFDEQNNRIVVDEAACQGCGMCAVTCPNSAAEVMGFAEKQTMAVISASLSDVWICEP
ncbi:MAG: FAD-dependent oxidoreductase [Pseudomonadota bacterium]